MEAESGEYPVFQERHPFAYRTTYFSIHPKTGKIEEKVVGVYRKLKYTFKEKFLKDGTSERSGLIAL